MKRDRGRLAFDLWSLGSGGAHVSSEFEVGNPGLQGLGAGPSLRHGLPAGRTKKLSCSPDARPVSLSFSEASQCVYSGKKTSGERHASGRITNWPSQVD